MTPDTHTITEIFLEVGDGHQIYAQEWGNTAAKHTILYVHGGPGGGCSDRAKANFDPAKHHVIFFDQRGCGRSLPYGSLENNNTDKLIADIEHIAKHFKVKQFVLFGGSWGSTLSLAYGIAHPERVTAMVLRGIFTARKHEGDWLDKGHFKTFYPDVWQAYLDRTPKSHHNDPTAYHLARVMGDDEQAAKESSFAYGNLEMGIMTLDDRPKTLDLANYDPFPRLIEMYYLSKGCFLPEGHIMNNAHKLVMPVHLVQGRYDFVCPPTTAYELHQKLPNSTLSWTISGHSSSDRGNEEVAKALLLQYC
jgi:proline iminopeptidase